MNTGMDIHITDYDAVHWQNDFVKNNSNHEQPGDPVKLSEFIYEISNVGNPPLHLLVGTDAIVSALRLAQKLTKDISCGNIDRENFRSVTGDFRPEISDEFIV